MMGSSSAEVHWHMSDLTSRIVAESGNPLDRYHLGKIILRGFRDDLEFVNQIDGASGRSETNGCMLKRSIRCATAMRKLGLKVGDVMVLMAPNHLDLAVPFYAALYLGIVVAPIDKSLGVYELHSTFDIDRPKIIFCQSEKLSDVREALDKLGLDARVVTFDQGSGVLTFAEMLDNYGEDDENFKGDDFNTDETIALLLATSGTTGLPKSAILTHKNMAIVTPYIWTQFQFPSPIRSALTMAPLQWLSTIVKFLMAPYIKFTRIQSPLPLTQEHVYDVINKYKPAFMILSPTVMATLLQPGERDKCDFTCFDVILLGGSAVHKDLVRELMNVSPKTAVADVYGMSEVGCFCFKPSFGRPGACGTPLEYLRYKMVDTETEEEILEPNRCGELWLKGHPGSFKGYYNNAKATEEAMTSDGWFKTGDVMYRDDNWCFYFVDRLKLLLKYKNHQISPVEVENTIRQHPGVIDVAVTGIPDLEQGDLVVACVIRKPGSNVSAQEIKDVVKNNLTETKQLRGGVVFMKALPQTPTTKLHRRKLKQMVLTMERE